MEDNNIADIEFYLQSLKVDIDILNQRKNEKLKILEVLKTFEENNDDIKINDEYLNWQL